MKCRILLVNTHKMQWNGMEYSFRATQAIDYLKKWGNMDRLLSDRLCIVYHEGS